MCPHTWWTSFRRSNRTECSCETTQESSIAIPFENPGFGIAFLKVPGHPANVTPRRQPITQLTFISRVVGRSSPLGLYQLMRFKATMYRRKSLFTCILPIAVTHVHGHLLIVAMYWLEEQAGAHTDNTRPGSQNRRSSMAAWSWVVRSGDGDGSPKNSAAQLIQTESAMQLRSALYTRTHLIVGAEPNSLEVILGLQYRLFIRFRPLHRFQEISNYTGRRHSIIYSS